MTLSTSCIILYSNLFTRKGTINSFGGFTAPNTTPIGSPSLGPKLELKKSTQKRPAIKFGIIVKTCFYLKQHRIIKNEF